MIVIGDEILNGRTVDANATFLTKYLFKKGLELSSIKFIRDNETDMKKALTEAFSESDIVITSGGIGPTLDDKTKTTFASYFGKQIRESEIVAKIVTDNYLRFGREWNPGMNHYHHFPDDFIAIPNPKGLAPGLGYFDPNKKKLLLSGPGVPREFFEMVDLEFLPQIKKFFSSSFKTNFQTVIRTQGVPEEKIFFELCPTLWKDLENFGKVSSLPHIIGIDIVVSYHGSDEEHFQKKEKIKKLIESTELKNHVWQWGNEAINELVLKTAIEKKKTFGFAESCSGGLCASKITDLAGSSQVFWGGLVAYDNSIKINILDVKKETLDSHGAVSVQVAREMAEGALKKLGVDFVISTSGIAGPGGGTAEKPVGTVAIGFATKDKSGAQLYRFPGDRIRLKERFSDKALLTLLELMNEN
jgi:nicotinamide-nucleotide amidase